MEYYCQICGDCVKEVELRSHAELHSPQATAMEWEDLLTNYHEVQAIDFDGYIGLENNCE